MNFETGELKLKAFIVKHCRPALAYDYGVKPEPVSQVTQAVEMALTAVPAHKLILGISAPSETDASIAAKVGIAKRYNLNGIALWRLGVISDGMWQNLRSGIIH